MNTGGPWTAHGETRRISGIELLTAFLAVYSFSSKRAPSSFTWTMSQQVHSWTRWEVPILLSLGCLERDMYVHAEHLIPGVARDCMNRLGIWTQHRFHAVIEALNGDSSISLGTGLAPSQSICLPFRMGANFDVVLQLETRPSSLDSRCLLDLMEGPLPIHVPSIYPHPVLTAQTQRGQQS